MATVNDTAMDLQPSGGTPFSKLFSCCLPKNQDTTKSRSVDFAETSKSKDRELEYEEPEMSEVEFDLPDLEEEESEHTASTYQAPLFVAEFWRLLFSLIMLDFMRKQTEPKRIKNE